MQTNRSAKWGCAHPGWSVLQCKQGNAVNCTLAVRPNLVGNSVVTLAYVRMA